MAECTQACVCGWRRPACGADKRLGAITSGTIALRRSPAAGPWSCHDAHSSQQCRPTLPPLVAGSAVDALRGQQGGGMAVRSAHRPPGRHATPRHGYVRAQPRRRGYSTRHRPGLGRSVTCHDVDARWWQASRSSWAGRDLDPVGVPDPEPLPGDRRPSVPSRSISYSWSIRLPYALRS